jgi:hypothetical protein
LTKKEEIIKRLLGPFKGPDLLVPKGAPGMALENSIYLPSYLTMEYRDDLLRDSGVSCAASFSLWSQALSVRVHWDYPGIQSGDVTSIAYKAR